MARFHTGRKLGIPNNFRQRGTRHHHAIGRSMCDAVALQNVLSREQTFVTVLSMKTADGSPHPGIGHARHLETLQLTSSPGCRGTPAGRHQRDRLRPAEQVPLAQHQKTFTVACRVQVTCVGPADFVVRDVVARSRKRRRQTIPLHREINGECLIDSVSMASSLGARTILTSCSGARPPKSTATRRFTAMLTPLLDSRSDNPDRCSRVPKSFERFVENLATTRLYGRVEERVLSRSRDFG